MNSISNFASESIQNKILLVPAVAVGAFVGSRAAAALLAVGLKGTGLAVNVLGVNTIGENLHASGDQLMNFATRSFGTELKISMKLGAAAVVGVGVATILTPPDTTLLRKASDYVGITIPAPIRLKGFTDSIGLTMPTNYIQNFPNSLPYKLVEGFTNDYLKEIPLVRMLRGLPMLEGNPILTNAWKNFSNVAAGISNFGSQVVEEAKKGMYNS